MEKRPGEWVSFCGEIIQLFVLLSSVRFLFLVLNFRNIRQFLSCPYIDYTLPENIKRCINRCRCKRVCFFCINRRCNGSPVCIYAEDMLGQSFYRHPAFLG